MTFTATFTATAAKIAQDLIAKGATPEAATIAAVDFLMERCAERFGE